MCIRDSREDVAPGADADEGESPGVEAVREKPDADAKAAICAELHDYSGEEHGGGGGRGYVTGGRPGMEGPHAGENCEAGEDEREAPHLEADGQAGVRKIDEVGGVAACGGVGGEQADEHHGRADEGVESELHGSVLAARGTPDGDEEVLGDDGDFVEDEEQEEIEAEEDAVNAADESEIEGEELVGAMFDVPTEENAGYRGKAS